MYGEQDLAEWAFSEHADELIVTNFGQLLLQTVPGSLLVSLDCAYQSLSFIIGHSNLGLSSFDVFECGLLLIQHILSQDF